ncbi:uncharacterized protein LOC144931433 isoform X3 [Lampetra fluviatilis]
MEARGAKRKRREAGSRLRSTCPSPPHRTQPITNFFKPKPLSDLGGASLPTEVLAPETVMLPSMQLEPCVNPMDPIVFLGPRIMAPSGGAGDGAGAGAGGGSGGVSGGLNRVVSSEASTGAHGVSGAVGGAVSGGVSRVVSWPMSYEPVLVLEKLQEDELLFHTRPSSSKLAPDASLGGRSKRRASGTTKRTSDDDDSGECRAGRANRWHSSFDHSDGGGGGGGNDADDDDEKVKLPSLRTRTVQQATGPSPETPIMERLRAIAQQREQAPSEAALLPRTLHWQPHTSDEEDEGEMDQEGVSERQLLEVPNLPSSLQHVIQAHMGPVYSIPDHPPGEVLLGPPCAGGGVPFSSAPLRLDGLSDEPLGTMLRSGAGLSELVELVQSRLSPVQWEQQWLFRVVVRVDRDMEADMARAALWKICSRSRGRRERLSSSPRCVGAIAAGVLLGAGHVGHPVLRHLPSSPLHRRRASRWLSVICGCSCPPGCLPGCPHCCPLTGADWDCQSLPAPPPLHAAPGAGGLPLFLPLRLLRPRALTAHLGHRAPEPRPRPATPDLQPPAAAARGAGRRAVLGRAGAHRDDDDGDVGFLFPPSSGTVVTFVPNNNKGLGLIPHVDAPFCVECFCCCFLQ